jgi:hypothetical protein
MQKIFLSFLMIGVLVLPFTGFSISLNDVFQNAPAMAGYDKVLMLDPDSVYTGGITIWNQKVAIWGNGATIDLQNSSIIAIGTGVLDIDGCAIINGTAGINVNDEVHAIVSNCVLYNNYNGIEHNSTRAVIRVYNTIFIQNQHYGLYTKEENLTYLEYNVAFNNLDGHYMAGCGS